MKIYYIENYTIPGTAAHAIQIENNIKELSRISDITLISYFKGNKISGRQLTYYTNGKKKTQGMVMNSKTEGRKVYFDKEGNTVKVEIYRAGELIDTIEK